MEVVRRIRCRAVDNNEEPVLSKEYAKEIHVVKERGFLRPKEEFRDKDRTLIDCTYINAIGMCTAMGDDKECKWGYCPHLKSL